jgi:2-C-methyl-D-erythritol 4-phosphate cytidylyltransferase
MSMEKAEKNAGPAADENALQSAARETESRLAAIVVAAGNGTRMKSGVKKQFMDFMGRPLVFHAVAALENSPVQDIVLVTGAEDVGYVRQNIVEKYGFQKVRSVTAGGEERWNSVFAGLSCLSEMGYGERDIVLIQDGARPFLSREIILRTCADAVNYGACAAAVRAKDTIKIADQDGFADITPDRRLCWQVQTPQAFAFGLIFGAYRKLIADPREQSGITDDAMVVEKETGRKIRLTEGSYLNIKITTPEDIPVGEAIYRYLHPARCL